MRGPIELHSHILRELLINRPNSSISGRISAKSLLLKAPIQF